MTESNRNPEGFQSPRGRAPLAARTHTHLTSSQQAATVVVDVAAAAQALRDRGIVDPSRLLEFASPEAILETCRWFDGQNGRVGLGVLVNEVKAGGKAKVVPSSKAVVLESAEYQAGVWEWCARSFPDLCDEGGLACPHVVAAVFRLHMVFGKGSLTLAEHGPLIRAAVFDRQELA